MNRQELEEMAQHPLQRTASPTPVTPLQEGYVEEDAEFHDNMDVGEFVGQLHQLLENARGSIGPSGDYLESILKEDPRLAKWGAKTGKAFLKQIDVMDALVDKMAPLAESLL